MIIKRAENGQGLIEYGLIIALIALVAIVAVRDLDISRLYTGIGSALMLPTQDPRSTAYCTGRTDSLQDWNVTGPGSQYWTASSGQLCIDNQNSGYNYAYNTCSQSGNMPNNSDYSVKLDGANLIKGRGYGVMFRMQADSPSTTGYSFQYDPGAEGFLFKKWVNGREYLIKRQAMPGYQYTGVPRNVVVTVKGDQMYAYIDGELVLQAADSTFTSGGAGLRTWHYTSACFSGFGIYSAP